MEKSNLKVLVIASVAIIVILNGCRKCYQCTGIYVCVECYKGTDTARDCGWAGEANIVSLLNQHKPLGYICDTFSDISHRDTVNMIGECITSEEKNQWEASGLNCRKLPANQSY